MTMQYHIGPVEKPKREIEVGSIVRPWDGSFAIVLIGGILFKNIFVAYPPNVEDWRVIVLDGKFPIDFSGHELSLTDEGITHNDTMLVSVKDPNKYCFILKKYLRLK